ncbi:GTPase IMAP family member 8-like protein [Labeo rohita]|uniref:GTPase IMAP family member 8-like protein n=1 Tax=Labeo rohita TaxID=84645 RepID=A0A498M2W9_LABRO|nr:GTPase IMAP family member 8-like protein [Labeo rohita]
MTDKSLTEDLVADIKGYGGKQMEMMENMRLNLVLLGSSGVGKSSTGNTILGRKAFTSEKSSTSLTQTVAVEDGDVCGLPVRVYDTPGFSNAEHGIYEEVLQKCESTLCSCLLVLRADRFTQEDERTVEKIEELLEEKHKDNTWIIFTREDELKERKKTMNTLIDENEALKKLVQKFTDQEVEIPQIIELLFGEDVLKYSIVLFTHVDQLKEKSVKKLIDDNENLRDLVEQCGGRYHLFNNIDENNIEQVNDLLQKIDRMIKKNGGGYYSNGMFEDALRFRQELEIARARKETEEKIRTKIQGENNVRQRQEEKKRQEEMEREKKKRDEIIRRIKAQSSEMERLRMEIQKDKEESNQEEKKRQEEIEKMRKETEEKSGTIEAQSSEIERLRVEMQKDREKKNQEEELRQKELERMRKEIEEKSQTIEAQRSEIERHRVEMQSENYERQQQEDHQNTADSEERSGFKKFFSKYWKYFLKGIAVDAIIGGFPCAGGVIGRVIALIVDKK